VTDRTLADLPARELEQRCTVFFLKRRCIRRKPAPLHRLEAADPRAVGELLVEIAASDGRQLRWPADARSRGVLATLLGQDDQARDRFLREVSGTDWWSAGADAPLIGSD